MKKDLILEANTFFNDVLYEDERVKEIADVLMDKSDGALNKKKIVIRALELAKTTKVDLAILADMIFDAFDMVPNN